MVSGSLQAALLLYVQMLLLKSQHIHCQQSLTTSAGIYSGQPDSCGYGMISPSLFPNGHLATFSSSSPPLEGLPQNGCGACLQLTCNDPSPGVCAPGTAPITVQIIDTSSSNLQLDSADITAVSSHGNRLGHIRVSVEQVNCAATGPITVRIEQLSPMANGYIKLALLNVAGSNGISSVAIAPAGTQSFGLLKNTYGAVWEGSVPTAPPLDLQISSSGQQLVLSNLVTAATAPGDVQSTVQFSPAASLGSGGAASPAAAAAGSSTASPAAAASPAIVPANTSSASPSPEALPSPAPAPQALPSPSPSPEALPSPASARQALPSPSPSPEALPSTTTSPTPSPSQSPTPAASSEASPSPMVPSTPFSSPGAASPSPAPAAEPLPATTPNGTLFNLVAAAAQQSCPTIFQTLSLSPDLTTWVNLIQGKGLQYNLNGTNQGITMFAPVNDAFSEPLLAGISGLDNAQTVLDLTGQIPDIISDLLGYSVVPQQLQENQLLAGDTFNTTNVIKTGSGVNGVPAYIPVGIKTTTDMTQVVGVGSIATIVQPNIQACGSIIHLVSNALLPFNVRTFDLQTQTPYSPASEASPSASPSTAVAG
ncbi:TPA: Expansin-B5 [Trebouxia sp. C0005]